MVTGWKKLTTKELQHLKENKIYNTHDFEVTIKWQREHPDSKGHYLCQECAGIAKKLGILNYGN